MRVVGLVEQQTIAERRSARHRGCGLALVTIVPVAQDHRRLEFGERTRPLSKRGGADDRCSCPKSEAACQGKTHQRHKQETQDGTLDQG
jgi:hypothetical protein